MKGLLLSFVMLLSMSAFSFTNTDECETERFSTVARILGENNRCKDPFTHTAFLNSSDGVTAVSYSWSISGDASIVGSTTSQTITVDPVQAYSESNDYTVCVDILGSDGITYDLCSFWYINPSTSCN